MALKLKEKTQALNIEKYVVSQLFKNACTTLTWTGAGENFSEAISYGTETGNIDQITREFGNFTYQHDETDQLTGQEFTW
ncbi:MAG: hypothetical protein HYV97_07265 [Bdellovibrio sp.]|nr:hypothetical protein [Bdellovibrio sp.]